MNSRALTVVSMPGTSPTAMRTSICMTRFGTERAPMTGERNESSRMGAESWTIRVPANQGGSLSVLAALSEGSGVSSSRTTSIPQPARCSGNPQPTVSSPGPGMFPKTSIQSFANEWGQHQSSKPRCRPEVAHPPQSRVPINAGQLRSRTRNSSAKSMSLHGPRQPENRLLDLRP